MPDQYDGTAIMIDANTRSELPSMAYDEFSTDVAGRSHFEPDCPYGINESLGPKFRIIETFGEYVNPNILLFEC